ncbi:MAG: cytochrome c [Planctomycetaceae bacterium]|nr:cytochrome c [Planctomycetaceae bacterium]
MSPLSAAEPSPAEGYRILREFPFLVPDFDEEVLDQLWTVWPEGMKQKAAQATSEERRRMTFEQYGIQPLPGQDYSQGLGYVQRTTGDWVMNCLACHGGQIDGKVYPGLGNADFDLQSLAEDVGIVKKKLGKTLTHMDTAANKGAVLSTGPGMTAAVNFGVDLGALRDKEMNFLWTAKPPERPDYGMDAPAFWNVKHKERLYCDDHAPNYHRVIMQFILHPWNNADYVKRNEGKFRQIQAWIQSVEAPRYPHPIDEPLAAQGKVVFNNNCAECHGTYENNHVVNYPERVIPLDEIGTDPVRVKELKPEHHQQLAESWLTRKDDGSGEHYEVVLDPVGYLAPPLKGIWASAPYLHNGSVPTLWHLLHPEQRPKIWKRTSRDYDTEKLGHTVETFDALPANFESLNKYERRRFYNHDDFGKKTDGHDYPSALSEEERRAVLEFLKTL